MSSPRARFAVVVTFAVAAFAFAGTAFAIEEYAVLASGQTLRGTAFAHDDIRLRFPLAKGDTPTLTFTLLGAPIYRPVSFLVAKLFDPDGTDVTSTVGSGFQELHVTGKDTLVLSHWQAPKTGYYELFFNTNQPTSTPSMLVTGSMKVARKLVYQLAGDETTPQPFTLDLLGIPGAGDEFQVVLRRVTGTAPQVTLFTRPSGVSNVPTAFQQRLLKTGCLAAFGAEEMGTFGVTFGYQAEPHAGKWRGTLRITKPFRGYGSVQLVRRNSPGIPLSVLDADLGTAVTFGTSGIGVDYDSQNQVLLVTSESGGQVKGASYNLDLSPAGALTPIVSTLATSANFSPGQTISGHHLVYMAPFHYLAVGAASGKEIALLRIRSNMVADATTTVVANSSDPTADFFLTGNGQEVAVGVFHPTYGHTVHRFGATDFGTTNTTSIGGPTLPEAPGAGAAWRPIEQVYELWTPTTLAFDQPSDLHRVLFNGLWQPTTADATPVADPNVTETMPTGVCVDPTTGVTIVHYVVPENPPSPPTNPPGVGVVHRRLFASTGTELPGSHAVTPSNTAPAASRNRPTAIVVNSIQGSFLYVGTEGPAGPRVDRYPLLR